MVKKVLKPWDLIATDQQLVGMAYNHITVPSAVFLSKFKWITPNKLGTAVLLIFLATTALLLHHQFILAAIGLLLAWYVDSLDGKVARWRGQANVWGEWYDKVTGFFGWIIFLMAFTHIASNMYERLAGLFWLGFYCFYIIMGFAFQKVSFIPGKKAKLIKSKKWYMRIFGEGIVPIVMIIAALAGKPLYTLYFFGAGFFLYSFASIFFQYRYIRANPEHFFKPR